MRGAFLLLAGLCSASLVGAQMGRDEKLKANWVTTSATLACEGNQESIKPYATLQYVPTVQDCMRDCEGRWGCLAVDFYRKSRVCHFYQDACTTPVSTADGAMSLRIKRPATWHTTSLEASCESETFKPFKEQQNVASSNACMGLCENRAGCIAVDFYSKSNICNMYKEACTEPKNGQDGAQSYRILRPVKWLLTSESKGCEGNKDNVEYQDKRHDPEGGIAGCKQWCERRSECRAMDFYQATGWCYVYDHACMNPISTADGVQSWRIAREGSYKPKPGGAVGSVHSDAAEVEAAPGLWSVIDDSHACLSNRENVKHFKEYQVQTPRPDIRDCQRFCENHGKCVAVDWYDTTNICLLYSEACSTPTADHDGGLSLRLFRADLIAPTGEETVTAKDAAAGLRGRDPHQL